MRHMGSGSVRMVVLVLLLAGAAFGAPCRGSAAGVSHGAAPHAGAGAASPGPHEPGVAAAPQEAGSSSAKAKKTRAEKALELSRVVLRVNHRVFANFAQLDTVSLDQEFPVGDSDLSARIIRFVPDFTIERDRRVVSRSNEPKNPAVQIVVMEAGAAHDTSWAFLNFPPHFSAKSVLAFQILRLDFENHEPLLNQSLLDRKGPGGDAP